MNRALLIFNVLLICILLSASAYLCFFTEKIAYINTSEVYDEFQLKKDLEAKLKTITQTRKAIADSLKLNLQMFANSVDKKSAESINKFNLMREQYLQKENQFKEDNENLAQSYREQIWKQLNQYVNDYGKAHGYSFIHGASGNGSLMYAQDKFEITKELIEYANEKYKGEIK